MKKKLFQFVFVLLSILIFNPVEVFSETYYYRAAYRDDPSTTISIGWSGDSGTIYYSTIDHGRIVGNYENSQPADRTQRARALNNHFARLTGLTPNTVYYFVVLDVEGDTSARYSIKTIADDPNQPISFVNGGDTRLGVTVGTLPIESCNCREDRKKGNTLVSKLRPDFIAFNGDFIRNTFVISNTNYEWKLWFEDWQLTIGPDGRIAPMVIATGNHEDDVDFPRLGADPDFKDVYNLFDIPLKDAYYALDFGGNLLRMYTLNSEMHGCNDKAQLEWLESDLQNYSTPSNTPYWKMVNYHAPIVPHSDKEIRTDLRQCWAPLFFDYNIQLAMESHSHALKTTYPIAPSTEMDSDAGFIRNDSCGTVYIGEGNWSAPQRSLLPAVPYNWTRQAAANVRSFFYITVSKDFTDVYSVTFDNIEDVTQALDDDLGSSLPNGVTLYNDAINAADAGDMVRIDNNSGLCVEVVTGIRDNIVSNRSVIYPNPVQDEVFIEIKSNNLTDVQIEVYDALGKRLSNVIINQVIPNKKYVLDVSQINSSVGVIMVKYGDDVETHKFIKQ